MPKQINIFPINAEEYNNLCQSIGVALAAQMEEENDGTVDPTSLMTCAAAALTVSLTFIQAMNEEGKRMNMAKAGDGLIIALDTVNELYKGTLAEKFNCKVGMDGRVRYIS